MTAAARLHREKRGRDIAPSNVRDRVIHWLPALALIALVFAALSPTLFAGFIWDDPQYILNNPTLRDFSGLGEMWTNVRSLPQWYPLVHTTFWLEFSAWGVAPLGYHIDNLLLHALSAILFWRLLKQLDVPGAWLAAAIFAVHPVEVESVAWVTERKNVLSLFFDLAALHVYLFHTQFGLSNGAQQKSRWRNYGLAFVLFIAALLSKSVTATFPAAVLVIIWWKSGRLRWRDFVPLVPFFIVALAMSALTSWLERTHVGADGSKIVELNLSLLQRFFIASRVIWFYAWKLVWPHKLTFIYPRWTSIDTRAGWLWIFPIALAAVLASLTMLRQRIGRGPLAAVLLFCGTLVPALGFVNVYPMRFSFVADHFQYHASIALIALCVATCIVQSRNLVKVQVVFGGLVTALLGVATFFQARVYHDPETLWRDTLAKNPDSWMVNTNLGNALAAKKEFDAAIPFHVRALELAPYLHDTHWNVGVALMRQEKIDDAEREFRTAMQINPEFAPAYDSLGKLYFFHKHDPKTAEEFFKRALQIAPQWGDANVDYAVLLERQQRWEEAVAHYRTAVANDPENFDARYNLGSLALRGRQFDEALANLSQAVAIDQTSAPAWTNLGAAQMQSGHVDDAIASFQTALKLQPNLPPAAAGLQRALMMPR